MAGPLTWRNVDAPDFRGAARGYEASAALLGGAFDSASKGLAAFGKDQQNNTDTGILSGLMKINDPKAYQDAVNAADLTGVSKQGLAAIGSRAGQLLQAASTNQKMQYDQYSQGRTVLNDQRQDAAIPGASAYLQAAATGDEETMQNLLAQNSGLKNLSIDDQQKIVGSGRSATAGYRSGRDSDTNYQNSQQDRREERLAMAAGSDAEANNRRGDFVGIAADLDSLDPIVRSKAKKALGYDPYTQGSAPTGSSGIKAGAGGKGAPGTQSGSPYDATVGFQSTSAPISSGTIGQAVDYGRSTLIPATRGRADLGLPPDKGSSAMGAYQITASTMEDIAPKVLGENWRDQPMSAENQDKLAQSLFEQRKGGDLSGTWTSLPNSKPGAYKDVPWSEMRNIISKGEVGAAVGDNRAVASLDAAASEGAFGPAVTNANVTTPNEIGPNQILAAQTVVGQRQAAGRSNNASANLAQNLASTDGADLIAQQIVKDNPTFDSRAVLAQIADIKAKSPRMTDAQAGAIVRSAIQPTSTVNPFSSYFKGTTNLGGDIGVNDNRINQGIDDFNKGVTTAQYVNNEMVKGTGAALATAQKGYDEANAAYNDFVNEMKARPNAAGLARKLPAIQEKRNKAIEKLQSVYEAAGIAKDNPVIGAMTPERKNQELNTPQRPSYRLADLRFGGQP